MSNRELDMFKQECSMRECTLHDNLIPVLEWGDEIEVVSEECNKFDEPVFAENVRYPFVRMEYVCNGELFQYLYHTNGFSVKTMRIIIRQIIDGLLFLKKWDLCHSDLKPENILIDEYMVIRICDYGFVRPNKDKSNQ